MQIINFIILGLISGWFSGLLGIGGGIIIIPALVYIFGMTQHQAQGTTLALMVLPIGLFAALKYYGIGNVDIKTALFISCGFLIGAYLGAVTAQPISEIWLKRIFGMFLFIIAVKMVISK